jgi:NADH-quinone oxidoreductase subunit J
MTIDVAIFAVSAVVAIFGAVMMIGQRSVVASVLYMILSMVAQAALYAQLGGMFIGAVLVIVYAGAILVLFLFVIMLLNLRGDQSYSESQPRVSLVSRYVLSILLAVEFICVVKSTFFAGAGATGLMTAVPDSFGSVEEVAKLIFTKYLYPFELTSILLITAIVGAVVIAKRERPNEAPKPNSESGIDKLEARS